MNDTNIKFDFYKNPSMAVAHHGAEYHVRINSNKVVNLQELASVIEHASSATSADVMAVMTSIKDLVVKELSQGNVVTLDGLCRLEPILGTKGGNCKGTESGASLSLQTVKVRPCKSLVDEVREQLKPCSRHRVQHSAPMTSEEVSQRLAQHFATQPYITCKQFQALCGFTRYRADHYLKQFIEEGKITHPGSKNSPYYFPA